MTVAPVAGDALYDPFDADIHLEPYAAYRTLRSDFPLYRNDRRGFWALSRYDDVVRAARDQSRFTASRSEFREEDGVYGIRDPDWIAGDTPRHAVLHKLLAPHLGRGAASRLEPVVRGIVERFVSRAVSARSVDFVDEVARPLPIDVICELWGVPEGERGVLAELSDGIWRREPGVMLLPADVGDAYRGFRAAVERIIASRRDHDGILGALVRAQRDGLLTATEVVDISLLVPATGFKTTAALLAASVMQLAEHPDQQRLLAADLGRAEGAVEEVLRFDPPVHWLPRVTTTEVTLEHGTIPDGDRVLLLLGSANRDPARFRDPDRFDITRTGRRHVAFGFGVHYCIGAVLARLLTTAALEQLFSRVDRVELTGPATRIYSSLGEREFASLPVRFHPR
jgi:cytochrome P450